VQLIKVASKLLPSGFESVQIPQKPLTGNSLLDYDRLIYWNFCYVCDRPCV
jgi:hypothetical protein